MATSEPPSPSPEEHSAPKVTAENQQNHTEAEGDVQGTETPSRGERLLPYIFACMETCWADALLIGIASLHITQGLLIPLWAPLLLIAGAYWLIKYQERREWRLSSTQQETSYRVSGTPQLFTCVALLILLIIWSSIYATNNFLLDPRWLLALCNDILLLNGNFYHILGILAVSFYFCWRASTLAYRMLEPGDVFRALCVGMAIILIVILLRGVAQAQGYMELPLLLLIPLFLICALIAHALAQTLFVRRAHPQGLQGSVAAQENALLTVVSIAGVSLLLVALLVGTFASPAFLGDAQRFLSPLGQVYDWLIRGLAYVITFLLTPVFWLISLLPPAKLPPKIAQGPKPPTKVLPHAQAPEAVLTVIVILKIVLPLIFITIAILAIWLLLRRRRRVARRRDTDIHESLWSTSLFWTQLKGLLSGLWLWLWRRFFPKQDVIETQPVQEELSGEPTVRSIREIYRAFLAWAARRGYGRKKDETPYEFQMRLHERLPILERELSTVTEAYTATRYSEVVPAEQEVLLVQKAWSELQQKAQ